MTLSARTRNVSGIVRPIALAAFRLTTSWYLWRCRMHGGAPESGAPYGPNEERGVLLWSDNHAGAFSSIQRCASGREMNPGI